MQFEEYALQLNAGDFASQSKAKAKPQGRNSASLSTRNIPIGERTWTDIATQEYELSDYSVSKKLINLLRHGSPPREDDGSIEFWRIKDYLQNYFVYCHHWSDEKLKSSMARVGGNKQIFQYCTDSSVGDLAHNETVSLLLARAMWDCTILLVMTASSSQGTTWASWRKTGRSECKSQFPPLLLAGSARGRA